jgi:hypothetical protein
MKWESEASQDRTPDRTRDPREVSVQPAIELGEGVVAAAAAAVTLVGALLLPWADAASPGYVVTVETHGSGPALVALASLGIILLAFPGVSRRVPQPGRHILVLTAGLVILAVLAAYSSEVTTPQTVGGVKVSVAPGFGYFVDVVFGFIIVLVAGASVSSLLVASQRHVLGLGLDKGVTAVAAVLAMVGALLLPWAHTSYLGLIELDRKSDSWALVTLASVVVVVLSVPAVSRRAPRLWGEVVMALAGVAVLAVAALDASNVTSSLGDSPGSGYFLVLVCGLTITLIGATAVRSALSSSIDN